MEIFSLSYEQYSQVINTLFEKNIQIANGFQIEYLVILISLPGLVFAVKPPELMVGEA